jgi:hypothetical protein
LGEENLSIQPNNDISFFASITQMHFYIHYMTMSASNPSNIFEARQFKNWTKVAFNVYEEVDV